MPGRSALVAMRPKATRYTHLILAFVVRVGMCAVAVGRTYLLPPLFRLAVPYWFAWLRFHLPLIEPDMQISRIRSRTRLHAFTHDTSCPSRHRRTSPSAVEMREWIGPALASPDLVLMRNNRRNAQHVIVDARYAMLTVPTLK